MKTLRLTPEDDLNERINSADSGTVIYLKKGVYRQKVEITASNIKIVGEDRENTVITYDDYARKIHADGQEYNTFRTYTLCITGDGISLENLTVENSNTDPKTVGQCVALSVHGTDFFGRDLDLKSTQDTLFLSPFPDDLVVRYDGFIPKRQLYREGHSLHAFENCKIYGTVDYVFGCSEAYFKDCDFINIYDNRHEGFVAAPAHHLAEEHGFNFVDCRFMNGGAGESEVFLARPWRDFGKCAFINCKLENHLNSALFDKWNDTYRDKTARFLYFNLEAPLPLSPVTWARELSPAEAKKIINNCNDRILKLKK